MPESELRSAGETRIGNLWFEWDGEDYCLGLGDSYYDLDFDAMAVRPSRLLFHCATHALMNGKSSFYLPAPSPELLILLAALPDHQFPPVVLEKLAEEYPELEPRLSKWA